MLIGDWIVDFLEPGHRHAAHRRAHRIPALRGLGASSSLIVAVGVAVAWFLVGKQRGAARGARRTSRSPPAPPAPTSTATRSTTTLVVAPGAPLVARPARSTDRGVDGVVEGGALAVGGIGTILRRAQNGFVRSYALSLLVGALLVVLALLAVNLA